MCEDLRTNEFDILCTAMCEYFYLLFCVQPWTILNFRTSELFNGYNINIFKYTTGNTASVSCKSLSIVLLIMDVNRHNIYNIPL